MSSEHVAFAFGGSFGELRALTEKSSYVVPCCSGWEKLGRQLAFSGQASLTSLLACLCGV